MFYLKTEKGIIPFANKTALKDAKYKSAILNQDYLCSDAPYSLLVIYLYDDAGSKARLNNPVNAAVSFLVDTKSEDMIGEPVYIVSIVESKSEAQQVLGCV